jgi:adenylate kinase family enzyme
MRVALLTGPSGVGKTFVADQLRTQFDCLSYDRLMRDSIEDAFPNHAGDKWDKQVWLDNSDRVDLIRAFERAFVWSGTRPLLVEGWQLREKVWRNAILELAMARVGGTLNSKLFIIRPTLEVLLSQRPQSKHEYHRRNAILADCEEQIARHEKLYREQPWAGELVELKTKEAAVEAVRDFLRAG